MKFEKVSYEQYLKDCISLFGDWDIDLIKKSYDDLKLPKRATSGSAGYDFFYQFNNTTLKCGETLYMPTGIKVELDNKRDDQFGYFLAIVPRSGLGFKYRLQLDNTIGIIDADYYNNTNNEGHIMAKLTNDGKEGKDILFENGKAYMQGIITLYSLTDDDETSTIRSGGIGSTDRNNT